MPRTGSTTFQHILARSRSELNKAGILYPDLTPKSVRDERHLSHQHFGETLDGRRPRREREELLESLSDALARNDYNIVLLSYEDFVQQLPRFQIPELLNEFFSKRGFRTEAIVVVKPQGEQLNSMYTLRTQLIRERRNFAHFANSHVQSGRFEYDRLIEPWSEAFSGRIRAVPVRDRRFKAPLLMRLLAELRLYRRIAPALQHQDMHRVENRSPGPVAIEISRRLRAMRIHARLHVPPREMMRVVQQLARQRGYDRQKFNGVGPELRAELDTWYRDINDRFARNIWKRSWDDIVAPEPACPINELIAGLIDPGIEADIVEILHQASQRFAIAPCRSVFDDPLNLIAERFEALQRRLRISQWRVV
jgi:hypothetical protein